LMAPRGAEESLGWRVQGPQGPPVNVLLEPPNLDHDRPLRRRQLARHHAGPPPPALLIEPRRAVVADGAVEPGQLGAALAQLTLRVCDERAGNPRASCPGRYVELVELIAFQHEEAERITRRAGDPQVRGGGGEPVAETDARAV